MWTTAVVWLAGLAFASSPEQRAVDYLAREVPRWFRENRCFSCHNNGDGARALYTAAKGGYRVPQEALDDTTRWLVEPGRWDASIGDAVFKDKKLARIQFAAALTQAYEAGFIRDLRPLVQAAEALLEFQQADGSWQVDAEAAAGSPGTYGPVLATYLARRTLERAGAARFADAIRKATRWLLNVRPRSVLDAVAMLLALPGEDRVRQQCLDLILRARASDGGWGPQRHAPAEPFDTAVVLLALQGLEELARTREPIERGRAFLIGRQLPSGGWPETTRPPGGQSYAQHISTAAWATLALLATDPKR